MLKARAPRLANPLIGGMWMLASGFLFAVMGMFVKLGSENLTAAELLFYRSLIGLLITYVLMLAKDIPLRTRYWRNHVFRGLVGFAAMMLLFLAITLLPLATAMTLNYTSPIFLTVVALVLHRDRMRWAGYLAIVSGFLGVVLLLQPAIYGNDWIGELLGLGSGFLAGIAIYHARQLGKLGESAARIVFYFMLTCTICSASWMAATGVSELSWTVAIWILGVGVFGTGGQLAMTRAYSISHSVAVSSLAYSTVLFTCIFGVLFLGDTIGMAAWAGIALIVLGGIVAAHANLVRTPAEP